MVLVKMEISPKILFGSRGKTHSILQNEIEKGLRVRMAAQGVTGTAYLEVDYLNPERNPPMEIYWTPKSIYIPSAPSTITRLTASVKKILRRLEKVDTEGISATLKETLGAATEAIEALNAEGIGEQIQALLAGARRTNENIDRLIEKGEIRSILADASATMNEIRRIVERSEKPVARALARLPRVSGSVENLAKNLDSSSRDLPEIVARLKRVSRQLDDLMANQRPNIERTLENIRAISQNFKELSERVKKDPSQILFGKPPPRSKRRK
ncbi:MAG: hypothetical protein JRJ26_08700 [Deltaproteobacteria bacterium]|nr:hypothetical protein [Deltaproteobacteria bacterium]